MSRFLNRYRLTYLDGSLSLRCLEPWCEHSQAEGCCFIYFVHKLLKENSAKEAKVFVFDRRMAQLAGLCIAIPAQKHDRSKTKIHTSFSVE